MEAIVGLFKQRAEAEAAVEALKEAGFDEDNISLVLRQESLAGDGAVSEPLPDQSNREDTAVGAALGAVSGAALGGFAGLLFGVGSVTVPGIGVLVASGALLSGLSAVAVGAGVGATAGGLMGALIGFGIPEEEARRHAEGVKEGGVVVVVHADKARLTPAEQAIRRAGAIEISASPEAGQVV